MQHGFTARQMQHVAPIHEKNRRPDRVLLRSKFLSKLLTVTRAQQGNELSDRHGALDFDLVAITAQNAPDLVNSLDDDDGLGHWPGTSWMTPLLRRRSGN